MMYFRRPVFVRRWSALAPALALAMLAGCQQHAMFIPSRLQHPIDRAVVEYPAGYELKLAARFLTAPSAIAFDSDGSVIIAENALGGDEVRIFGFKNDGTRFDIYPRKNIAMPLGIAKGKFLVRGPVGGMVVANNRLYVTHRDANDRGVVTSFDDKGNPTTVVADLPAEGDYGVTDVAISPDGGRLYFGVGSVTNSGVVGADNWEAWTHKHEQTADLPGVPLKLLGYRFDSPNPRANFFGGNSLAVTAPFQPFGQSKQTWVRPPENGKPSAAIYSVSPKGGDVSVEANGLRYARGLAFNAYGRLYATNAGMELRGTRPVKDDPNTLLRVVRGTWYGWPDYSADLWPINDPRFQPPSEMMIKSGYAELSFLIDHQASGLLRPDRHTLLQATFPVEAGAARLDFVPADSAFREYRGSAIIALSGNHAEAAGQESAPVGRKIVCVDVDARQTSDFVFNIRNISGRTANETVELLERPVDVKFSPDGSMYILDCGRVDYDADGQPKTIYPLTGKLYRLQRTAK